MTNLKIPTSTKQQWPTANIYMMSKKFHTEYKTENAVFNLITALCAQGPVIQS